jgi:hypothetical protein
MKALLRLYQGHLNLVLLRQREQGFKRLPGPLLAEHQEAANPEVHLQSV